jgi:hypothetical protein
MKKKIILIISIASILVGCGDIQKNSIVYAADTQAIPAPKEEEEAVPLQTFEDVEFQTSEEVTVRINEYENYNNILIQYLQNNYLNKNLINKNAQTALNEYLKIKDKITGCKNIYNTLVEQEKQAAYDAKMAQCAAEYESATYIWQRLIAAGLNESAAAGILGNIMVEVGGFTLNIPYWTSSASGTYYGMCQWNIHYYGEVVGAGLEGQCDYLLSTIENQFNSYGYLAGVSYESFKQIGDCETAALAFAEVYERCGSSTYSIRQSCARTAYNYFAG